MNNQKKSNLPDRLSELPDSLIFDIFREIPMSDIVRTTILSKRWKNLWTTIPFLNFRDRKEDYKGADGYSEDYSNGVRNFVNQVLSRWNGERILKFVVEFQYELLNSAHSDIDRWLAFAKKNEVKELYLHLHYYNISLEVEEDFDCKEEVYWVPQFVYSCSSLKELSFKHCNFGINGDVEWNQLKSLKIEGFEVTAHVVSQMLCGSPLLEVFMLSFIERGESYSIRSTSLKVLSIYKRFYDYNHLISYSELRIWTPNLQTLEIRGLPYRKCLLMDVSSLTHATLGISGMHFYDDYYDFPQIEDRERGVLSVTDFLGDKFSEVLPTIQHVENITLLYCCIKVIEGMKKRCMHSTFPNVKSLHIGDQCNEFEQLAGLLEIFPQLNRLVLKSKEGDIHDASPLNMHAESYLNIEANLPKSFLQQLRTIEVKWIEGDNIFLFMEFLLKYACKLEKIVFGFKGGNERAERPSNFSSLASHKLLTMPRSSPNAKLIIYEF